MNVRPVLILLCVLVLTNIGCVGARAWNLSGKVPDALRDDNNHSTTDRAGSLEKSSTDPMPVSPYAQSKAAAPRKHVNSTDNLPETTQSTAADKSRSSTRSPYQAGGRTEHATGDLSREDKELLASVEQDAPHSPFVKQQILGLLERQRRKSDPSLAIDNAVLLGPSTAAIESPINQSRNAPSPITPHVTVNVHATPSDKSQDEKSVPSSDESVGGLAPKLRVTPATIPISTVAHHADLDAESPPEPDPDIASSKPSKPASPEDWQRMLRDTIAALEAELRNDDSKLSDEDRMRQATYLRLLYIAANRPDDVVRDIETKSQAQREYWKDQLHALLVALDADGIPVESRRSALALRHLRDALNQLAAISTLDVRNLTFCSRVDGFGMFAEFPRAEFKPDQEVLLYTEVDNFAVEKKSEARRADQFETELKGSYQVFDASGRRVADVELPLDKQTCRNHRRDYFIAYRLYIPKQLTTGPYTLQLTIQDVKGDKFGQGSMEFKVKE